MGCCVKLLLFLAVPVALFAAFLGTIHPNPIPPHMLGHPVLSVTGLMTDAERQVLRDIALAFPFYATNANDLKSYTTANEHIGEAVPIGADGSCGRGLLVPSVDRKQCILPGRVDVARHFILTGGVDGLRESFTTLAARTLSFGRYIFSPADIPPVAKLFASDAFSAAGRSVCPPDAQYVEPFQSNFIVQVPGQSVPAHIDAPYFQGASRFHFPQWILAAAVFGRLMPERFVNQVQIVTYLHSPFPEGPDLTQAGGEFVAWGDNSGVPTHRIRPTPGTATAVDGSKTVHAAAVFHPDAAPPAVGTDVGARLVRIPEDPAQPAREWSVVRSNGSEAARYRTADLRIALVFRARCFRDAAAAAAFHAAANMTLPELLDIFRRDLPARGRHAPADPLELAHAILGEYVAYPMGRWGALGFNFCVVARAVPALESLLKSVCP